MEGLGLIGPLNLNDLRVTKDVLHPLLCLSLLLNMMRLVKNLPSSYSYYLIDLSALHFGGCDDDMSNGRLG